MAHRSLLLCLVFLVLPASAAAPQANNIADPPASLSFRPNDPLNRTAFDHFYNLDYDRSV